MKSDESSAKKPSRGKAVRTERITFQNAEGQQLAARLELPPWNVGEGVPRAFCIFAHCFTCSKDIPAASRISRALSRAGFGVLRFDFTGLGSSDGDFANTNFSSNVDDLVRAAGYLEEHHRAPALLVGHSLGGAAVLAATRRLASVEAVVSIGAPSDPGHVKRNFAANLDEIERVGEASVQLAGRTFKIKQQFLEDLDAQNLGGALGDLQAALLVMHSPLDETVPIEEAQKIYQAARGYRSFVSLGDADHLLSKVEDAEYVAAVIGAWATRYVTMQPDGNHDDVIPEVGDVIVEEIAPPYTNGVRTHRHGFTADEPAKIGGADLGPAPFELLLAGLGACTSMTLRMYADRKGWPLERVSVALHLEHVKSEDDPKDVTERFERVVTMDGDLDADQRKRLLEIADRCPVHRTLENPKVIVTREG
ncbi:MAG: putative redox protein [Planctomycetota bacterium]|jgi:putative redox protein